MRILSEESDWEDLAEGACGRRIVEHVYKEHHVVRHRFPEVSEKEGRAAITFTFCL